MSPPVGAGHHETLVVDAHHASDEARVTWARLHANMNVTLDGVIHASRGTPQLSWEASTQVTDVDPDVRALRERHAQIHTWGSAIPGGTAPMRFELVEPPTADRSGVMLLRYGGSRGARRRSPWPRRASMPQADRCRCTVCCHGGFSSFPGLPTLHGVDSPGDR
jgi:hypothetical protein